MTFHFSPCLVLICVAVSVQAFLQSEFKTSSNECSSSDVEIHDPSLQKRKNSSDDYDSDKQLVHHTKKRSIFDRFHSQTSLTCSEESYSCAQRSCPGERSFVKSICYCDRSCEFFQDCCFDYQSACNKTARESDFVGEDMTSWACVGKFGKSPTSYWMKTKCPKSWLDVETESMCINAPFVLNSSTYMNFFPVFGADSITYRNQHCAKCNYQARFEFWAFNISLKFQPVLQTTEDLIDFLVGLYKDKVYNYVAPGTSMPRRECHIPISNCSKTSTSEKIQNNCSRGYVAIVYDDEGKIYRNRYCTLCNEKKTFKCQPIESTGTAPYSPPDFYLGINFKYRSQSAGFSVHRVCPKKIYDHHLKECVNSEDIVSPVDAPLDKYRVVIWLIWPYSTCGPDMGHFLAALADVDASNISNVDGIKKLDFSVFMIKFDVQLTLNQSLELIKNFSEIHDDNKTAYSILQFLKPFTRSFSLRIDSKMVKIIKTSTRRLGCVGLRVLNSSDYSSIESSGRIYVHQTKRYYRRDQYFEDNDVPGVIKVCEKQLPNDCNGFYRKYERGEFEVRTNLSLYHNGHGVIYEFGHYTLHNNSVYICHEINEDRSNVTRQYLTFVGLSLSIFCLVIVFVTYMLFAQLRTAPGKNIVNLTIGLVLQDIISLVSPMAVLSRPLCTATAFAIQYFILLVQVSMAKIAHDTLCMFTDPIAHQCKNSTGKSRIFFILWLIPLVFVALCFLLWHFNVLDVEYTKSCWLSGRHVYILLYIPVCLAVTFNVLCFTRSMHVMRKLEQNSQMLRAQKQEKSSVFIYIKISTLLGLGWTSTFIAVHLPVFSYVFVVLTVFQGAYIFLAFVCNKNVLLLYRNLYGKQRGPASMRSKTTPNRSRSEAHL